MFIYVGEYKIEIKGTTQLRVLSSRPIIWQIFSYADN